MKWFPLVSLIVVGGAPGSRAADGPPAFFTSSHATVFAYAGPSDISRGAAGRDEMDSMQFGVSYTARFRVNDAWSLSAGLGYERWGFSLPAALPVPNTLHHLNLPLGARWNFAETWTLSLTASPGLYSDFEDIDGGDFGLPFSLLLTWSPSPEWQWILGFNYRHGREAAVLPAVGFVWSPDDRWTVSVTLPRPSVSHRLNDATTLFVGGELAGGAFRVAEEFGQRHGNPALDDELLTYREIRVGAGVRHQLLEALEVSLEAGWMIDRRFVFDDADLQFNGDGAPYVRVGVGGRF